MLRRLDDEAITLDQLHAARIDLPERVFLTPPEEVFDRAFDVALPTGVSFYDALYVATAEHLHAVLVTSDRRLIRKLAGSPWAAHIVFLHDWLRQKGH